MFWRLPSPPSAVSPSALGPFSFFSPLRFRPPYFSTVTLAHCSVPTPLRVQGLSLLTRFSRHSPFQERTRAAVPSLLLRAGGRAARAAGELLMRLSERRLEPGAATSESSGGVRCEEIN